LDPQYFTHTALLYSYCTRTVLILQKVSGGVQNVGSAMIKKAQQFTPGSLESGTYSMRVHTRTRYTHYIHVLHTHTTYTHYILTHCTALLLQL
jgi:hypothetical protein